MKTILQDYLTKKQDYINFKALPLKVLLNLSLDDLIVIGTRAYTINKMSTKVTPTIRRNKF